MKRKILSALLAVSIFCLSAFPVGAAAETENEKAADYRVPCGSFLQHWQPQGWSDTRWELELKTMKEAGMEYVLLDPSVSMDAGGVNYVLYPSEIPEYCCYFYGVDCIEACLRNCKKAGMKVFIALNQDAEFNADNHFWTFGWKISKTQPDACTNYWRKNAEISNELADEIYRMYKSRYQDTFYGWYWVHEFWNYTICTNAYENKDPNDENYKDKVASDPTVYTDILAEEAFNPVLEHLTELDSSMPMLFSSFYNPTLCKPESMTHLMSDIFKKTNFRKGDIWAPMDGMGGGLMNLDILDSWTAAAKKAADANSNLAFWINNECQVINIDPETGKGLPQDDEVALMNRVVKQIEITSQYAEKNILFTWNHYYSPYMAMKGFNKTYMQYVKTGKIEKNAPKAIDKIQISKNSYGMYQVSWQEPEDDVGIAVYNVYQDGERIEHFFPDRPGNRAPILKTNFGRWDAGEFEIEAVDFAGNVSPRVKVVVNDNTLTDKGSTTDTAETTTTAPTDITDTTVTTKPADGMDTTYTTNIAATTDEDETDEDETDKKEEKNPKTGSSLPKAAAMITLIAAGIGAVVKTKQKQKLQK